MSRDNVLPMSLDSFVTYVLDLYTVFYRHADQSARLLTPR